MRTPDADPDDDDLTNDDAAAEVFRSHSTGASLATTETATARRPKVLDVVDDVTVEVLRLVEDISPEAFAGLRPYRRKALAAQIVRKARGWGMTEPRDMAIYCVLYRYPGPRFFRRPAWLDGAERVRSGQTTWAQVFEEPQLWNEPPKENNE